MKIPSDSSTSPTKGGFYLDILRKCEVSMQSRREAYGRRRNYYLYGAGMGEMARYNKIRPQLETLVSFIYSAETTRFTVNTGASLNQNERKHALAQAPSINRKLLDEWYDTNADQVFRLAVLWASIYDSMLIKMTVRDGAIIPYLIEPSCFGVLREDISTLDVQEAFIHRYYLTASELANRLIDHPKKEAILRAVTAAPPAPASDKQSQLNRMMVNSISIDGSNAGNMSITGGNPWDAGSASAYAAEVEENVIEVTDLYILDDSTGSYRIVTIAEPGVILFDMPMHKVWLKDQHPFIKITPDPTPDYFWGFSDVDKLSGLQDMYNTRIEQIIQIMNRQANPPYAGRGMTDEQTFATQIAGGFVRLEDNGDLKIFEPDIPTDLFAELDRITEMFSEALGISNVLSGRGEAGVRSKGHASELARLGSARIKQRALVIEDSLEKMAGLYLKGLQFYDATHFYDENGLEFILKQFTEDHFVKVDAHSNSPIFVEDNRQMAFELFKLHVITKDRLIELIDPPMKQQLIEDAKRLMAEEKEAAKQHAEQAQKKSGGKPHGDAG